MTEVQQDCLFFSIRWIACHSNVLDYLTWLDLKFLKRDFLLTFQVLQEQHNANCFHCSVVSQNLLYYVTTDKFYWQILLFKRESCVCLIILLRFWHDTIHLVYLYAMPACNILHLHWILVVYTLPKTLRVDTKLSLLLWKFHCASYLKVVERSLRCNSWVLIARNTFYHEQERLRKDKSSPKLWLATRTGKGYPAAWDYPLPVHSVSKV